MQTDLDLDLVIPKVVAKTHCVTMCSLLLASKTQSKVLNISERERERLDVNFYLEEYYL